MLPTRASMSAIGSAGGFASAVTVSSDSLLSLSLSAGAASLFVLAWACSAAACSAALLVAGAGAGAGLAAAWAGVCAWARPLAWRCSSWRFRVRWKSPSGALPDGISRLAGAGVEFGEEIWEIGVCMMGPVALLPA